MPDQPNEPMRDFGNMEREIVYLLTDPSRCPTVWSVADIGREIGYADPEMLVRPLCGAGLLHRVSKEFVFATPGAFHLVSLVGQVV
ncbi:MAG TPA: hypothetical protein VN892_06075 [Solirubrobacteraceae bacterium]|nr:hypothetical protein [Solirubrobacteraceae bacterium]